MFQDYYFILQKISTQVRRFICLSRNRLFSVHTTHLSCPCATLDISQGFELQSVSMTPRFLSSSLTSLLFTLVIQTASTESSPDVLLPNENQCVKTISSLLPAPSLLFCCNCQQFHHPPIPQAF